MTPLFRFGMVSGSGIWHAGLIGSKSEISILNSSMYSGVASDILWYNKSN